MAGDAFIFLRQVPHFICMDIVSAINGWTCDIVLSFRGENEELRVGVRRHMRQQTNIPSSVISSHSMHIGVLATAAHAITTGTIFSVFYKPRSFSYFTLIETLTGNKILKNSLMPSNGRKHIS